MRWKRCLRWWKEKEKLDGNDDDDDDAFSNEEENWNEDRERKETWGVEGIPLDVASSVQSKRCGDRSISMDDSVLPGEDYFTWSSGFHLHDCKRKEK